MIIVDTSIWFEFLKGNPIYFSRLQKLLENQNVLVIDCIFAELLQGAKDKRERDILLLYWNNLPKVDIENLASTGFSMDRGLISHNRTELLSYSY